MKNSTEEAACFSMINQDIFTPFFLDENHYVWVGKLPAEFAYSEESFNQIWDMHPPHYHTIKIHGKEILTPRWQQAYGLNYRYTGSRNNALPISPELFPFQKWSQENIDSRFNSLLLNWYDGSNDHYIGKHRDDIRDMVSGSSIVTISLGEERIFRMRPWKQKGMVDIPIAHGDIVIMPWETNLAWTHEVPNFKKYQGKRISITLRAFNG